MTDVDALTDLLATRRTLVLSGAGISTDSGIPDYRGPTSRTRNPTTYQTFVRDEEARRRYWARSSIGWPLTARARPNGGHGALARLERRGATTGVLTQNVDGLHQRGGSRRVLELHGSLSSVICLACGARSARATLQERLGAANPGFHVRDGDVAPDGDVEIADAWTRSFRVPPCLACGGVLKPDVVFFGENVPRDRLERAWTMLDQAEALLVVGSSLTVFSGYRFVRRAREQGKPIAIVNDGATRGDADATVRSHARLGTLVPELARRLGARDARGDQDRSTTARGDAARPLRAHAAERRSDA
ncbi:MAG: NAD-dependent protein deacetylase [Trueperaceae bacterium]|nr:NAD-dependent protein deacetylase [Trueperaceae bacterium]